MNQKIKNRLRAGLNKMLEDCHVKISAFHVRSFGENDIETINEFLMEWEKSGLLKIKKPYEKCQPDDICVKMINFIESGPPHDRFWENAALIKEINED